jgi:hypothetical protein
MGTLNLAAIIGQLDVLLADFEDLQKRSKYDDLSDLKQDSMVLANRLQAAFDRLTSPSSTYGRGAEALRQSPHHLRVVQLSALAYAMRDDFKSGWFTSLVDLVHAETLADLLEMSSELLRAGYKDAAAVIVGTALELHLRSMATKAGLSLVDSKSKPKKADAVKIELRKAGAVTPLQEKQITVWLGLRNAAAHGDYANVDLSEVARGIDAIAAFIDANPA